MQWIILHQVEGQLVEPDFVRHQLSSSSSSSSSSINLFKHLFIYLTQTLHQVTVVSNFPSFETTPDVVMKAPSPVASWFSLPRWFHGLRFGWEQLVHLHHDPPNREEVEVPFRREEAPGAKARIHRHHLGFGHYMDVSENSGFSPQIIHF